MSIRGDEWIVGPGDTLRPQRRREPGRRRPKNRPPERRPPRGLLWPIVRAVVAAILVGAAGVAAVLYLQEDPAPPAAPIQTTHFVNDQARYEFDYPKSWKLRQEGTRTVVQHPERVALVSFGVAPSGNIRAASDVLVGELRENNLDVETGDPRSHTIGGHPAIVVNGTGMSQTDQPLRFLAITVHVGDRNYSIVMFAAVDADPDTVVAPAQTILDSFRPPLDPPPSPAG